MNEEKHFPMVVSEVSKAPDLSLIQQDHIQEILFGQVELAAARSKRTGLLEIIRGLFAWPRRIIFIRRLRNL